MGLLAAMIVLILLLGAVWAYGMRAMRQLDDAPASPRKTYARRGRKEDSKEKGRRGDVG